MIARLDKGRGKERSASSERAATASHFGAQTPRSQQTHSIAELRVVPTLLCFKTGAPSPSHPPPPILTDMHLYMMFVSLPLLPCFHCFVLLHQTLSTVQLPHPFLSLPFAHFACLILIHDSVVAHMTHTSRCIEIRRETTRVKATPICNQIVLVDGNKMCWS